MSDLQPDAVYYHSKDYAHVAQRIGVLLIDFAVCVFLMQGLTLAITLATVPDELRNMTERTPETQAQMSRHMKACAPYAMCGSLVLCAAYSILLRKTRGGTIGYRIMRVRLIDKAGNVPSWATLGKRFLLGLPFAFFFGLAYLNSAKTERRQSFHDQVFGTWVIKTRAQPAGQAVTAYLTKLLGTYLVTYIDVEPFEPETPIALPVANASENVAVPAEATEPVS